jgi:two-component system, NarL family, response regulator DesR
MRPTRVLYVENDPALRGVISMMLQADENISLAATCSNANETIAFNAMEADVALLDLNLGEDSLNGTELGLLLRERNPNLGIVIFTQHVVPDFVASLPEDVQWGWSFLEKRSDLDVGELIEILRATARGLSVLDPAIQRARRAAEPSVIDRLTHRQREILSLAATGLDASAIADQLGLAAVTVRQELSKAYAVLVPDAKRGTDLRTTAVLRYLSETRLYAVR